MNEASVPSTGGGAVSGGTHERRGGNRYLTICRVAVVRRAGDMGLWRVRNISDAGLMLAADVPVRTGEVVEIELSETVSIAGKVVWADQGNCGVAFTQNIDAVALLHALALEHRADRYRALRLPIDAKAILIVGAERRPIDLVNLSQRGAGFRIVGGIQSGLNVDLLLCDGKVRRRALIRWSKGQHGGLWFTHPLNRADLESIARLQRGLPDR